MDKATAVILRGVLAGLVRTGAISREHFDETCKQIAMAAQGSGQEGEVGRFISDLHQHLRLDDPTA
jgi:hypothetical protein